MVPKLAMPSVGAISGALVGPLSAGFSLLDHSFKKCVCDGAVRGAPIWCQNSGLLIVALLESEILWIVNLVIWSHLETVLYPSLS